MASKVEAFLSANDEEEVVEAIRKAELRTSGEIRVHLERTCAGNAYTRAQELFHLLKMDNTKDANGILFYLAVDDRKFAVLGDSGINNVVPDNFWNSIKDGMEARFRESEFKKGLVTGIELVGEKLAAYFPWHKNDVNELPDQISTS
ncbi:TPM domain-containing protein [Nonlabens agnitus]|uniref:TPM domain-containing protein n=1 Tax=Nonlabens agnitus TaxID=870484 RepID=A0A2S9WRW2_9FLAO|nr:TPM domain-containing protein [Nonlabens agnitus]PRP66036.1 hypothetical protein BST86_02525 [Nonlabens agnitus]